MATSPRDLTPQLSAWAPVGDEAARFKPGYELDGSHNQWHPDVQLRIKRYVRECEDLNAPQTYIVEVPEDFQFVRTELSRDLVLYGRYVLDDKTDITFPDPPSVPVALVEARQRFGYLPDALKPFERESKAWERQADDWAERLKPLVRKWKLAGHNRHRLGATELVKNVSATMARYAPSAAHGPDPLAPVKVRDSVPRGYMQLVLQEDVSLAGTKVWILSNVDFMQRRGPPPKDALYNVLRVDGFCGFAEPTEFAQWHVATEWHWPYIEIAPWQCDPPRPAPHFLVRNGVFWYRLDFHDCVESNNGNISNFDQTRWIVGEPLRAAMEAAWASLINDAGFWKFFRSGLLHGFPEDTARRTMYAFVQVSQVGLPRQMFRVVFGRWQAGMREIWGWNLMWHTRAENGRRAVKELRSGRPSPSLADTEVQRVLPARGVYTSDRNVATLYAQDNLSVYLMAAQPPGFKAHGKRLRLTNFAQPELEEHVLRQGEADWLAGARDYTNNASFGDGGDTGGDRFDFDDNANVPLIEITPPTAGMYKFTACNPSCLTLHSRSVPAHFPASRCHYCVGSP